MPRYYASIGSSAYPQLLGIANNTVGETYNKGLISMARTAIQVKSPTEFVIIGAAAFSCHFCMRRC